MAGIIPFNDCHLYLMTTIIPYSPDGNMPCFVSDYPMVISDYHLS
jgi:hypothetical protein